MTVTPEQKERNKAFYLRNREYFRIYRLVNREKSKAYSKAYYKAMKLQKQELQRQELEKRSVILRNASVSKEHSIIPHCDEERLLDPTEDNSSVGSG